MKVFRGLPNAASRAACALAIGNFDGVHRGHQALLAQLRAAATARGVDAAVMTFEPHPREYFAQRSAERQQANGGADGGGNAGKPGNPGNTTGNPNSQAPARIANL